MVVALVVELWYIGGVDNIEDEEEEDELVIVVVVTVVLVVVSG